MRELFGCLLVICGVVLVTFACGAGAVAVYEMLR